MAGKTLRFNNSWTCEKCLPGAICDLNIDFDDGRQEFFLPLPLHALGNSKGYWRVTWLSDDEIPIFERCPYMNSCLSKKRWSMYSANNTRTIVKETWEESMRVIDVEYPVPVIDHNESCAPTTTGVLCGVCKPLHYRVSASDKNCKSCEPDTARKSILQFALICTSFLILMWALRRRISTFKRKHMRLWRTMCRLSVIVVNYAQIGTSLPSVIDIQWPAIHLKFLSNFTFFNIDLVSLLGLRCLTTKVSLKSHMFDYRLSIVLACITTFCSAFAIMVGFNRSRRRILKQSKMHKRQAGKSRLVHQKLIRGATKTTGLGSAKKHKEARYILSSMKFILETIDINHLGYLNEHQFRKLLIFVNYKNSKKYRNAMKDSEVFYLMRQLGATAVVVDLSSASVRIWIFFALCFIPNDFGAHLI